jgi:hypothetical protein
MGVSGFGPAPQINPGEFERRLREGVHRTGPNDAPSNLPRTTESSSPLPHPALSRRAPNALERARTRKESTEPLDVRSPPQLHVPPGNGTSIVDAEDPRTLDVDDFRRWWQQRLAGEAAQDRSRGRKLPRMAIALTGFALISSALVLKGGVPPLLKTPPVVPPANDIARAHNFSGQTAGTPADISTMPPAGLSGTTPVAPVVDAQAVEGSEQTTDPEPARRVSVRPEGTLIASQVSSAAERRSSADPKPPAKPASEPMNGTVGATQPSIDLPAQRRGKVTARVVRVSTKVGLLTYDGRPSGSGLDLASASASAICSGPALVDRQSGLHDADGSRRILGGQNRWPKGAASKPTSRQASLSPPAAPTGPTPSRSQFALDAGLSCIGSATCSFVC